MYSELLAVSFRCFCTYVVLVVGVSDCNAATEMRVAPNWSDVIGVSSTTVSIQVCAEPPMRRGSAIHDQLFRDLRSLKADYARFQPWRPYPRLAVAELYAPHDGKTSWNFDLIDPIVEDFMTASEGRPVIFTFGTIPSWMFNTTKADEIPEDPDEITWTYGMQKNFTGFDSTVKLFAAYQARLAQWYLRGGFKDEYGRWHRSSHHYTNITYWGVLNEPGAEHALTSAQYLKMYDAVVTAVRKVAPEMKFVGLSDDNVWVNRTVPGNFPDFLDRQNHREGIFPDAVSYHFYARPDTDETFDVLEHTTFNEADRLLTAAAFIEALRRHLSPKTQTILEELGGSFLPWADTAEQMALRPIDSRYWTLSGAMWAYMYGHLLDLGIQVISGAELIDYPGQAASASLVDWSTGKPNARYWVLKLIHDNLLPGTKLIREPSADDLAAQGGPEEGQAASPQIYWRALITTGGRRVLLLVNKRHRVARATVKGAAGGAIQWVDEMTTNGPAQRSLTTDSVDLAGFEVAIVTLKK